MYTSELDLELKRQESKVLHARLIVYSVCIYICTITDIVQVSKTDVKQPTLKIDTKM